MKNLNPVPNLTINIKPVNVICFGNSNGSATATPAGGTGPYSYSWNTVPVQTTATATGLTLGIYTVTVTDNNGYKTTANVLITKETNIGKWLCPDKIILETYTDINKKPKRRILPITVDNRIVIGTFYLDLTEEQKKLEVIIDAEADFIEIDGEYYYVPEGRTERLTQTEIDIYLVKKILSDNIQIIPKLLDYQLLKYQDKINRLYELEALFYNTTRFYISQNEHKKDHQKICKKWVKRQLKKYPDEDENKEEKGISLLPEIKPIFKPEMIETIFASLKDSFSKQHQTELKKILQNGSNASTQLIFLSNGNRLAYAFKQLYEQNKITGCQKNELAAWIQKNFCYRFREKTKVYTPRYLEDIISTNKIPCKHPLSIK
jgi:hypothetical protein